MKQIFSFFLLTIAITSCSFFEGSEGDDPPCEEITRVDARLINAIPYRDEQTLTFEVSDGTDFMAVVRREAFTPQMITGCLEEISTTFSGLNVNSSLNVDILVFGEVEELLTYGLNYTANGRRGRSISVILDEAGTLAGDTPFGRIIPDTTLNGSTYTDVLAVAYGEPTDPQTEMAYYNLSFGLIGVELPDGTSIFLANQ
ncbi:hypothetical protein [Lewinella sp. 4G2]|uniref:hypothetical protein n=1 Tax=Lewinella sp. 4G2 TaxID=1803372 RepID=UPI0007B48C7E|nr:hypothetical protein [Lewinella sp. 4G2]OAV42783.1 hypothetical protein A3850_016225 [Lewinella sp. 4G2]